MTEEQWWTVAKWAFGISAAGWLMVIVASVGEALA